MKLNNKGYISMKLSDAIVCFFLIFIFCLGLWKIIDGISFIYQHVTIGIR